MNIGFFFDPGDPEHFVPYTGAHLASLLVLLGLALAMFRFRITIRSSPSLKKRIRTLLLLSLLLPEAGLYVWYFRYSLWDIRYTLPLELCSMTLILSIVMLATGNRLLYQILFFAGIGGALQAVLTPNLGYPFPHFIFFHFFIAHSAIILAPLYMTWIEGYRPTLRSIGLTMLFLNVLLVIFGPVDRVLGANYMFLLHKPETASLLDLLGPYPYYLLSEELIALVIFLFMYVLLVRLPRNHL
ncbi:TIGR02206 family membrane protein [Paenibacillus filicis]|uniref:TIGR02206 family membrane protein n=1 Tax=Paenibacillus gyeongsangnamensis TaxID=3388067 RepID=A0ABT4Q2C0_9BACL|nr:TIGR02206 family membrane protein [Paenibacillus filicis]MCZ8511029.1 TIGR02206 family membrane protein [Paenibacillus filicis]